MNTNKSIWELSNMVRFSKPYINQDWNQNLGLLHGMRTIKNWNNLIAPNSYLSLSTQLSEIVKQHKPITKAYSTLSASKITPSIFEGMQSLRQHSIPQISSLISNFIVPNKRADFYGNVNSYLSHSLEKYINENSSAVNTKKVEEDIERISSVLNDIQKDNELTKENIQTINETLQSGESINFTFFIIQIILSILLTFFNENPDSSIVNNITLNVERDEIQESFSQTMEILCLEKRKARTNVNLRTRPTTKSAIIGVIPKDRIVLIQSIKHKWIYIVYHDEDYTLKSGWVYKKYFERTE